jgi:hypothetical protein
VGVAKNKMKGREVTVEVEVEVSDRKSPALLLLFSSSSSASSSLPCFFHSSTTKEQPSRRFTLPILTAITHATIHAHSNLRQD